MENISCNLQVSTWYMFVTLKTKYCVPCDVVRYLDICTRSCKLNNFISKVSKIAQIIYLLERNVNG